MNKNIITLTGMALIVGGLILAPKLANAYQGDPSVQGPDCTAERHESMEQAFVNNDYNTWKELMNGKGRVTQVITAENFARFVEAHELAEEGNIKEANAIRQELGLGLGSRNGDGSGQGAKGHGMGQGWER